jgi:hypothetical protein
MSIQRSVDISWAMIAFGKIGARSDGPRGCRVPGCNGGGRGTGRSAAMLYQALGMRDSSSRYLIWSLMVFS